MVLVERSSTTPPWRAVVAKARASAMAAKRMAEAEGLGIVAAYELSLSLSSSSSSSSSSSVLGNKYWSLNFPSNCLQSSGACSFESGRLADLECHESKRAVGVGQTPICRFSPPRTTEKETHIPHQVMAVEAARAEHGMTSMSAMGECSASFMQTLEALEVMYHVLSWS
jgi:hypothetical protein